MFPGLWGQSNQLPAFEVHQVMVFSPWTRIFLPLVLAVSLFVTACGGTTSSSTSSTTNTPTTSQTSQGTQKAVQPLKGGAFNRYFPKASGDYSVVFSQEKTGAALAKLKQQGKEVALLSVTDTANNPNAATKFKESSQKIGGYPAITQGKGTAVLVANRFQVKVQSQADSFTSADQKSWIQKFDLAGIASLK